MKLEMEPRGSAAMQRHLLKPSSYLLWQPQLPCVLAGQPYGGVGTPPLSVPGAALSGLSSPLLVWKRYGLKDLFVVFQDMVHSIMRVF